jgi:hypothetical protein
MKSIRNMVFVAAALVLAPIVAREARAQAPTVSFNVSGPSVTIQWTPVPGASIYDVFVSGTLSGQVQLPAAVTVVRVNAPVGTYGIQVRGRAGSQVGPLSNMAMITVGGSAPPPPTCTPPAAPTVTATVSGASVNVSWNAVSGATGYAVQFSRTPGGTELVLNAAANQTSITQAVNLTGTFYVRVVALSSCGNAPSNEANFTVGTATAPPGSGPRSPNPPPGQLIPRSSLGYAQGIAAQIASQYHADLLNSCRDTGGNNTFMFRLVQALRRVDTRWGMNDKRGNRGDMSQDIVTYNPTDRPDDGESQIYLFDAIGGHCGPNPTGGSLGDVTDGTWAAAGNPACGTRYCARWTIDNYLRAGFTP